MSEKKSKKLKSVTKSSDTNSTKQRTMSRMNPNQKEAIIVFMEGHCELLGAAVSKLYAREAVERLWVELTDLLNELGHVPKPTSTWKKTWFDMKREVKAKLGPPPYPPHLLAPPDDQSMAGQRGRIAALMTQAVRICQEYAASSLDNATARGEDEEESRSESVEEVGRMATPPVEISVKCEPPEFAEFDIIQQGSVASSTMLNGAAERDVAAPPAVKRPRVVEASIPAQPGLQEVTFAAALQMLAASQDRNALAMEGMAEAARGLSEVFRRRTAVEIEKVEALKQIACAIRSRPF